MTSPALRTRAAALIGAALACVAGALHAQAPALPDEAQLRQHLSQHIAALAAQAGISRFEVRIGNLDALAQAAPCRRTEVFVPPLVRPWGRVPVGVRCQEGATWTVLVPATVAAWAPGLVAATALQAGGTVEAQDLVEQEVDLSREPALPLRDARAVAGRTLLRAVAAGQPVRPDMTRPTLLVQPGDPVRLRIAGPGFAVSASGQALTGAAAGQSVRVRTESGRVLSGIVREARTVEVAL